MEWQVNQSALPRIYPMTLGVFYLSTTISAVLYTVPPSYPDLSGHWICIRMTGDPNNIILMLLLTKAYRSNQSYIMFVVSFGQTNTSLQQSCNLVKGKRQSAQMF